MTLQRPLIRTVRLEDERGVLALEQKVWKPKGVPAITSETFQRWVTTYPDGFLVAERGREILGFAYHEIVDFDFYDLQGTIDRLQDPGFQGRVHDPSGKALYGVTVCTHPPGQGTGKLLFQEAIQLAQRKGLRDILTFSRLPGLQRFFTLLNRRPLKHPFTIDEAALHYAVQAARLVGGAIDLSLALRELPEGFLFLKAPDPVLGRFSKLMGMTLHAIVPSSFEDPESCNRSAFMVRSILSG